VKAIVLKAVAGSEFKGTFGTGEIFVALAVHKIFSPQRIAMDNHVRSHVLEGLLAVTTGSVQPAIQIARQAGTKFAMLAPRAFHTGTRLAGKVIRRGQLARAALDAKDRKGCAFTIIAGGHGQFARRSDVARFEGDIHCRHTVADELIVAVLILAFNADPAVSVVVVACVHTRRDG
jgi:hypothetical protein